jgi:hypothetical protein
MMPEANPPMPVGYQPFALLGLLRRGGQFAPEVDEGRKARHGC